MRITRRARSIPGSSPARVLLPVISQVVLPSEGLATYVTRIGTLVGVRPLVDQQIVALGELSTAEFTNKLLLGPGGPASPRHTRVHRDDRSLLRSG